MDIFVAENNLRRELGDESLCKRRYGAAMAEKIKLRLAAIQAADSLADFWPPKSGPERCHELHGDYDGIFSIDLKQPYRLLFKPHPETATADRSDEQQRWKSVTAINILEIKDTHE